MAARKPRTTTSPTSTAAAGPETTTTRGMPRKCTTVECGTLFFAGKKVPGYAVGYGEKCNRCHKAEADGRTPGARQVQPKGKGRIRTKVYLRRELVEKMTPEVLKRFDVENQAQLASLALATLLGAPELR